MKTALVLAGMMVSSCSSAFARGACDNMLGSWAAPEPGDPSGRLAFRVQILRGEGGQYLLRFTQSTGTYPFVSRCVGGVLVTGGWAGDAGYNRGTDQLFMQGYAFVRQRR